MTRAPVQIIGIDCATEDARIGLAHGIADGPNLQVLDARQCSRDQPAIQTILEWITTRQYPQTLLAIDAPLGWPAALGKALAGHQAGDAISVDAHDLFRRETDRFIKRTLGKQPLDVGADRIARTAHAALGLLGELRRLLGHVIPLAWATTLTAPISAIEVYPAATLVGRGCRSTGYKNAEQAPQRREIIAALHSDGVKLPDLPVLEQSADALDAALCLVAAHDFLLGCAMPPSNPELAKREGWIWARHHSEHKQPYV